IKPCNKQCYFDVLPQEEAQLLLNKTEDTTLKMVEVLSPYLPKADFKIVQKTLTLGSSDVAPGQKVMGAALAKLNDQQKSKLYVLLRRWDKKRPLKDILKAHMPELDDDFIEHFEKIANQLIVKQEKENYKIQKRVFTLDDQQRSLNANDLTFLYWDESNLRDSLKAGLILARNSLCSVFLKRKFLNDNILSAIDREMLYYQLVRDIFKMGDYLVPVNTINLNDPYLNFPEFKDEPAKHGDWLIFQSKNALPLLCCSIDLTQFFSNNLINLQKFALIDFCLGVKERLSASLLYNFNNTQFLIVDNDVAFFEPSINSYVYLDIVGELPVRTETINWMKNIDLKELSKYLILLDIPQSTILNILKRASIIQSLCNDQELISLKELFELAQQLLKESES
ncbi:MAG: hypothetical protein RMK17_02555, partial [bacterium]|nr:hypothetical protein [bacterium]